MNEFNRFAHLEQLIAATSTNIGAVIVQAHTEGLRDGIQMAADYLNALADTAPTSTQADALRTLRDAILCGAHQIRDPDTNMGVMQ